VTRETTEQFRIGRSEEVVGVPPRLEEALRVARVFDDVIVTNGPQRAV
jgi:hypothetical protein